jgi:hypothetical protein
VSVVTADQFVAGLGQSPVETKHDELRAATAKVRNEVARRVRKLNRMRPSKAKDALRAETDELRRRHDEMWNAGAHAQMVEIAPNHYATRDEADCERMAVEALERFRSLGWIGGGQ